MIPSCIVKDFASELQTLLISRDFRLSDETGQRRIPSVYEQSLPPAGKNNPLRVPYVLVVLYNGEQVSSTDPRTAMLHIIAQTYDSTVDMQGYIDGLNLLELICQHLYGKTVIAGQYEVVYPYQFATLDDVRYPYFSAGLAIRVEMPGMTPQNTEGGYAI